MHSDYKFVIFLIVALILFAVFLLEKKVTGNNNSYRNSVGRITMVNMTETGNVWYKVAFNDGEKEYVAQSVYYRKSPDDIRIGDSIKIGYYFTRTGSPRCVITEEGFEAVNSGQSNWPTVFLISSAVFLALFLFFLFRKILVQ